MNDKQPILIFPKARKVNPPPGKPFRPPVQRLPAHKRQVKRVDPQMDKVEEDFRRSRSVMSNTLAVGEPELVLIFELASRVEDLKRAVAAAALEWLCEWDVEAEADEDFPAIGNKTELDGRVFVSMVDARGLDNLLSLWKIWKRDKLLPNGKKKWEKIFECLKTVRCWGVEDTLIKTGMKKYFDDLLDEDTANFQIECFYYQNKNKREEVESNIRKLVDDGGGELISDFIDMPDISFHSVKANMPVHRIKALLDEASGQAGKVNIFYFYPIMYFHQTGQSITSSVEGEGQEIEYPQAQVDQLPVVAILDGAPNLKHKALEDRVDFDDPFDLMREYQLGEHQHGTIIASLVIHGDQSDETASPLNRRVYHVAVMQPNKNARRFGYKKEHFPNDCFFEDRIQQAVRRMLEGEGEIEAQAPTVKIINLSLGDDTRPFFHTPSPWARLLDWLSWKYKVLFCVSAGNYTDAYEFFMTYSEYQLKTTIEKIQLLLDAKQNSIKDRRLFAPAESINALTVGALHQDESGNGHEKGDRVDLLPSRILLSPISRLGHGFRSSVKPEIYFPGGRQLYKPLPESLNNNREKSLCFEIDRSLNEPGLKVAWDSDQQGDLSKCEHVRGTSNATALATRAGAQIHEVLFQLRDQHNNRIPDNAMAILIKTMLIHGSMQNTDAKKILEYLRNTNNSRTFKKVLARYLGYGSVDIERVLGCTNQRGTVIGHDEISASQMHEYRFPIPGGFSGQKTFRRMVITLAWFSPINPRHRYLREAKLEIKSAKKWEETPLCVKRSDSDHNQVKKGTVQHEVLKGENKLKQFQQDEEIVLQVVCKEDATESLEDQIPYGIAVTLEVAAYTSIPVYTQIRDRLSQQVAITGP